MSTQNKKQPQSLKSTGVPVAIVGMAGIFPQAENLERYWANIMGEVNCISEVPASRWSIADYYDPDPNIADKTYSKHGGFIPDIHFDPMEFGLPPNFLEVTDVSQLLGLVVARDALSDAGYPDKGKEILDRTGVILGMVGMSSKVIQPLLNRLQYPVWEKALRSSSVPEQEIPEIIEKIKLAYVGWNENAFPGAIGNVVAGRIANRFDLGGTNCIVDAACGSSLAAVSMAVAELSLGRADMMITGGVDTDNSILTFLCFSKTPAFSKGDRLRAFSAESDGMLAGEGIGMLVLKRLADAEKDGDQIYAVIRGVGTSSDGYFKSIYAPRPSGQSKALRRAYENAGYSCQTVGLIEAHGTGTNAGDPAEFEGLREVFSEENPNKQVVALGSVKSQIGHTKATAGAASLIKAALALHHQTLPATINVSKPNPAMAIEDTPFYLNTHTRPWFARNDGAPRRAGVSSFGFGGTNFHIAVEEYTSVRKDFVRIHPTPYTVLLSADTPQSLLELCRSSDADLSGEQADVVLSRLDEASSSARIPANHARVGFVAVAVEDAREKMAEVIKLLGANAGQESWSNPKGIFFRSSGIEEKDKTVALFPGQGSQYVNMGLELAVNFPLFREAFEHADAKVMNNRSQPLTTVVFPIPVFSDENRKKQQDLLTATENAQPAIGAFSMALYRMLNAAGFRADFFAGHSFGELTALWAGGVLEDDAFLRLAAARGQAMSAPAESGKDTGSMAAVKGDLATISELIKNHAEVKIANFNSPSQVVIAGSTQGIRTVQLVLEKAGMSVYPLNVSAAFHTQFVGHAKEPFTDAIQKEKFRKPKGKIFSNSTAKPYPADPDAAANLLSEHILNSVRFQEEIENIFQDGGRVFVEIGPKNVLSNLVRDILGGKPHEIVTFNPNIKGDSDIQFRQAVLQLRVLGFALGNTDPHKTHRSPVKAAPSKVAVKLNGGLYTSEATKQKYEEALMKTTPKLGAPVLSAHSPIEEQASRLEKSETSEHPSNLAATLNNEEVTPMANNNEIEAFIQKLQSHQSEILKTHDQYLQNDHASKKLLQQVTSAELALLIGGNGKSADERALGTAEKRAEYIASQHEATSRAHQAYIQSQTEFTRQYTELVRGLLAGTPSIKREETRTQKMIGEQPTQTTFVESPKQEITPSAAALETNFEPDKQAQPGIAAGELEASFLAIVTEKTGYPVDMLELSMDMEADLGIDSIKRVEILGAMQEKYPELPSIEAEALVELRTLAQVIGAFKPAERLSPINTQAAVEPVMKSEPIPASTAAALNDNDIQSAFLEIVSEKTGYPVDMLEMGMDMEADLGIDSIKRVEILGAVQEKFSQLPTIDAEELVELRTLAQVIGAFKPNQSAPGSIQSVHASTPAQPVDNKSLPSPAIPSDEVKSAFLEIVSEKTGYPTDMLELSMDMEADLGIDSIKRVEILGAVQEKYPELPSISAEEMVELRTLGQIIEIFSTGGKAQASTDTNPAIVAQEKAAAIAVMPVAIKQLPRPDLVEVEYPQGSTVLITAEDEDKVGHLAGRFSEKGLKVGLIHLKGNDKKNDKTAQPGVDHYTLENSSDEEIASMMQRVAADHSQIVAFLHIEPARNEIQDEAIHITEEGERSLKSVFLIARHLKSPLSDAAAHTRSAFLTVTQMDGQFGLNGYKTADPLPGGFAGLTKTLRLEWPNVFCRALDFHPEMDAEDVAEKIHAELLDADLRLSEVGYTPEGRFTVALREEPVSHE